MNPTARTTRLLTILLSAMHLLWTHPHCAPSSCLSGILEPAPACDYRNSFSLQHQHLSANISQIVRINQGVRIASAF